MRILGVTGLLAITAALPLSAQRGHQFELGAFGSFTRYDRAFNLSDQAGGGGRLGYFFGQVVGAAAAPVGGGHITASARLPLFFGAGSLMHSMGAGAPDRPAPNPATPLGATVDLRGCPMDSDADGVYDGLDQCPNTPTGAHVDPRGCPMDSDSDGVYDGIDQCPNTPAGARVDAKGCPIDSDGDGVPDGLDKCPNTPAGATVDSTGCPLDGDKDGVPDGLDKCPNTPTGTPVDSVGCPMAKDSDGDGVDDSRDKCPGTAPGTRVDAFGCPILFTPERRPVVLRGVTFETGKSALRPESYALLDVVAQSLLDNPEIRIEG